MMSVLIKLGIPVLICAIMLCIAKYYTNVRNFLLDLFHLVVSIIHWGKRTSIRGDIQLVANNTIKQLNKIVPELQMPEMNRRIGQIAWYSTHTMSQWVKLRGKFAAYSFVCQQMALYL